MISNFFHLLNTLLVSFRRFCSFSIFTALPANAGAENCGLVQRNGGISEYVPDFDTLFQAAVVDLHHALFRNEAIHLYT